MAPWVIKEGLTWLLIGFLVGMPLWFLIGYFSNVAESRQARKELEDFKRSWEPFIDKLRRELNGENPGGKTNG
jgi:hypothetical protein